MFWLIYMHVILCTWKPLYVHVTCMLVTMHAICQALLLHHDNSPAYNKYPEHPAVLGQEKHRFAETTTLFTWPCSMWLFSFPQAQGDHSIEAWQRRMEKCIILGITLKVKPCNLLFGLEINCLWHQSHCFSDTPPMLQEMQCVFHSNFLPPCCIIFGLLKYVLSGS